MKTIRSPVSTNLRRSVISSRMFPWYLRCTLGREEESGLPFVVLDAQLVDLQAGEAFQGDAELFAVR